MNRIEALETVLQWFSCAKANSVTCMEDYVEYDEERRQVLAALATPGEIAELNGEEVAEQL